MEAGRAAIARRAEFLLRRQDFCIETTLATRTRQPVEIVRKELAGTSVHDEASLKLLNEAVAVAGGQPLAGT